MSDFTSNFWSLYVTGISLVGIFACLLLLVFRTIYPLFKTSTTLYSVDPTQKIIFPIIFLMMIISGVGYLLLLQEEKEIQVKKLLDDKDKFFSIKRFNSSNSWK